ncbi:MULTISPECIES: lipocalin family protein [unclassified Polaribacter]|uniref:lipocalin family protein n=1 Tax=unclassified Polaribacter TaxID=196858 RepID=UPI0011BEA505|nr:MULTISPECIES: lipocalin family protein [unclassified Polaribacter]TXD50274.1 lipocalin family protein [Polaribacter sp. IC063]TXD58432.1 lipocalin family protein [Polaribacter sp. IC066]
MKKIYKFLLTIVFLSSCSSNDNLGLSTDKVVGSWSLISQIIDGKETITDCAKQTIFTFQADRVLTQTFYSIFNNGCNAGPQIVSNWFYSGNSQYRIESTNGTLRSLEFIFTKNNTKFSLEEADSNGQIIVSVFVKII